MKEGYNVFITLTNRDKRKVIIKRGIKADNYFDYCHEVGCDTWEILSGIKSLYDEPVAMWLPDHLIKPNTSKYVQGVEVAFDDKVIVPIGFEVIELPPTTYLKFQGEPFVETNYDVAISQLQAAINKYDPANIGYLYDDESPRLQLEPIGTRGYIELIPVKKVNRF